MVEVLKQKGFTRYNFGAYYGFGISDRPYIDSTISLPGKKFFINTYRKAPISFNLVNTIGWWNRQDNHKFWFPKSTQWHFSGSIAEPHAGWKLRVGRVFVGGRTPKWIQKLLGTGLQRAVREFICCRFQGGHQLKSESYITPDSGSEDFWCERCGWSEHISWY